MSIATFFHPALRSTDLHCQLSQSETQHANAARRLGVGQQVKLLNGIGLTALAEIVSLSKREFLVDILESNQAPSSPNSITVLTAVPKGDRQRFLVEGLTQLGVNTIIPLDCEFSATSTQHKSVTKWPRYAIEAVKQSGNPWLPKVLPGIQLIDLGKLEIWQRSPQAWVAHMTSEPFTAEKITAPVQAVAIGPEGGFSAEELNDLSVLGFQSINLAQHVLRTETAAIAAGALLQSALEGR